MRPRATHHSANSFCKSLSSWIVLRVIVFPCFPVLATRTDIVLRKLSAKSEARKYLKSQLFIRFFIEINEKALTSPIDGVWL